MASQARSSTGISASPARRRDGVAAALVRAVEPAAPQELGADRAHAEEAGREACGDEGPEPDHGPAYSKPQGRPPGSNGAKEGQGIPAKNPAKRWIPASARLQPE